MVRGCNDANNVSSDNTNKVPQVQVPYFDVVLGPVANDIHKDLIDENN